MSHDSFHDGDPPVISSKIVNATHRKPDPSIRRASIRHAQFSRESRDVVGAANRGERSNSQRFTISLPKSKAGDPHRASKRVTYY
jgi:hypothetical protein